MEKYKCPICGKRCDNQPTFYTDNCGWMEYVYENGTFNLVRKNWDDTGEIRCSVCDKNVIDRMGEELGVRSNE